MNEEYLAQAQADAAKLAEEMQQKMMEQMQAQMAGGSFDPTQMVSGYFDNLSQSDTLQQMVQGNAPQGSDVAANQMAMAQNMFADMMSGFNDDDEDDGDYDTEESIIALCERLYENLGKVSEIETNPAENAANGDPRWLQAGVLCTGVLSNINGHDLDNIYVEEQNNPTMMNHLKQGLSAAWGIDSREDLFETLEYLQTEGHRTLYAKMETLAAPNDMFTDETDDEEQADIIRGFLFVNTFKGRKTAADLLAWDIGRAGLLVRWGLYVGMLTEQEAEYRLTEYAKMLAESFNSWQAFGNSYQFGAAFWKVKGDPWSAREHNEEITDAVIELLTMDIFAQPGEWSTTPWLNLV